MVVVVVSMIVPFVLMVLGILGASRSAFDEGESTNFKCAWFHLETLHGASFGFPRMKPIAYWG